MSASISVRHNIEVAHRLYETSGKCEAIHGHSMWVTLTLKGDVDRYGILEGINFGALKKIFRGHLDEQYDHHVLLNASDPFAQPIYMLDPCEPEDTYEQTFLPGLSSTMGDPTTENIARWIGEYMETHVARRWSGGLVHSVDVWETSVNMARWEA